jgi:hypothetical protein
MKAEKSRRIKARRACPAPEVTVLTPKIAANGAPQGDALPHRTGSETPPLRLAALHPLIVEGANEAGLARATRARLKTHLAQYCARTNARAFLLARMSKPHARMKWLFEN